MSDSLIIIPTYNEKENIEKIIRKVFSLEKDFHILIIEDGSPDGTANINLKTKFDDKLTDITGSVNMFNSAHADYGFSGVHFIVPENATVGSNNADKAGIDTGERLVYGSTEIKSKVANCLFSVVTRSLTALQNKLCFFCVSLKSSNPSI